MQRKISFKKSSQILFPKLWEKSMNPKKPWNVPPEDVIREALERPEIWEEKGATWKERKPNDEIDKTGQRIVDIIRDL